LRGRLPEFSSAVWALKPAIIDALLAAGADKVATTMLELRDQVIQASQIISVQAQD
jgi:hypothetical protein